MLALVSLWGHGLAALLFGALAVFTLRRWNHEPLIRPLVTAFAALSVWAMFLGLLDGHASITHLAESARNLAFLAFLYGIFDAAEGDRGRNLRPVFALVAGLVGLQIAFGGIVDQFRLAPPLFEALRSITEILGIAIAAGSMLVVHNLYGQTDPASRGSLRFPLIALAGMWACDLHFYTVAYFSYGDAPVLFALRGLALAALAPVFALGLRRNPSWRVAFSRAATFQTLSLVVVLVYLMMMMSAARAMELAGKDWGLAAALAFAAAMTGAGVLLIGSPRLRATLGVLVAKHMFEHRYDYRAEWLRFTDTVGRKGEEAAPLEERVIKALADIGGAPGGLLLVPDGPGRLTLAARWDSVIAAPATGGEVGGLVQWLGEQAFVVDFAGLGDRLIRRKGETISVPEWLADLDGAWAGIPLNHGQSLVGLVILDHPPHRRPLDWEDFDLFRAAGIQAASYIAEARNQMLIADAQRFDEFNRRFAFILHDVKNLASQLALLSRNAARHAEKPEFRADMNATLRSCVKKLNDLLARLSPGEARDAEPLADVALTPILESLAGRSHGHPIRLEIEPGLVARAQPGALEQALVHLVQNAIDASPEDVPVRLAARVSGGEVVIEIEDRGLGMSEEFIRTRLFQPFASTKEAGFGIGAYEARTLLVAMGARLEVESSPGRFTRFTLIVPAARGSAATHERKSA